MTRSIAVTGANGFIGRHLVQRLGREEDTHIVPLTRDDTMDAGTLAASLEGADIIVHLAAMNRGDETELYDTNVGLVRMLVDVLHKVDRKPHVVFSSSTRRDRDDAYGRSKREGEAILEEWNRDGGGPVSILEIPNVFGPGCKPYYNSVVATFCHQLSRGEQPQIHVDQELTLIYVGDLVECMAGVLEDGCRTVDRPKLQPTFCRWVSQILGDLRRLWGLHLSKRIVPIPRSDLDERLFRTFLSHVQYEDASFSPEVHRDDRGALWECVRQEVGGQVFFSTTKPGVVRGNHYHTRKREKFCVLSGSAIIRLRALGSDRIIEYQVSGRKPEVVDIPLFHVHNIENIGDSDLLTLFWSNETYNPSDPDTFYELV